MRTFDPSEMHEESTKYQLSSLRDGNPENEPTIKLIYTKGN